MIFFDVGGPIYDDRTGYEALLEAMREERPDLGDGEYWAAFDDLRRAQDGSFAPALVRRLLPGHDVERLRARSRAIWPGYQPADLHADALPVLERLARGPGVGLLANQRRIVREALRRDGIEPLVRVFALSEEVGFEKPDPRLFEWALARAGVPPGRAVLVGDRLDLDVRAARRHGMRGVWILRNEAPDVPGAAQLAEADAVIRSLAELPEVLGA